MNDLSEPPAKLASVERDVTTSRLAPAVAIIATLTLGTLMPDRYRITPPWLPYAAALATLGPMGMVFLTHGNAFWRNVERNAIRIAVWVATAANILNIIFILKLLIFEPKELQGTELLAASVATWVSNVVVFALLYWLIDRDGPDARSVGKCEYGDFLFPEQSEHAKPPGWKPTFIDYLYLAFTGATGFGVTHTVPVSRRAKLLIMTEAQISLITIVVIGARAVGILQ